MPPPVAGHKVDVLNGAAVPEEEPELSSADRWSTDGGKQFLSIFRAAKRGKRYPTESSDLALEGLALAFFCQYPDAFSAAKDKMQKENRAQTRGFKRKDASTADEEDEGDE
jgi:hypothetical protein